MNSQGLLQVNGVEIFYKISGQGVPLILLHGNGEDMSIFDKQVEFFSPHFQVICIDSRGHGKSTHEVDSITYDVMANDVLQIIDFLNITKCHIIGFSDGGILALELAMRVPQRLLSITAIGANYNTKGIKLIYRLGICAIYCYYSVLSFFCKKYKRDKMLMQLMLKHPNMSKEALSKVDTPALIVVGSWDMVRTSHTKQLANLLTNSRLEIIPHCSHFVLRKYPNTFNQIALEFLPK